jgi:hypothetical protein
VKLNRRFEMEYQKILEKGALGYGESGERKRRF